MELPSPSLIRTFRKAFELKNFTAAAKALAMTQSGVSQHVAQLENVLGTGLFERVGRSLLPTKAGEQFYHFGGAWLAQIEDLIAGIRDGETHLAGRVVIGAPGGFGVVLLRRLVAWQKQNPGLVIEMEYGPNLVMERELGAGRMDLAVTSAPLDPARFRSEEFYRQEYVLVSHPEFRPNFATYKEFAAQPIVDYVGSENIFQTWCSAQFRDFRASRGLPMNIRAKINNMESIFFLLEQRVGITVFPKEPLEDLLKAKRLKAHKSARPVFNPLFLCERRSARPSLRQRAMRELISSVASR